MVNILLTGCLGRLGTEISEYINELDNYKIIAGLDIKENYLKNQPYKIYNCVEDVIENNVICDVVIDFSNTSALKSSLNYCLQTVTPLVLGTTDISEKDKEILVQASKKIPIFWSVNMSIGINLLTHLCNKLINSANDICEIDIIEHHHNAKVDAPSGTASLIANLIKSKSDSLYNSQKIVSNNSFNLNEPRGKNEIRVHSIRAGNITGQNDVIFNIGDEVLTLSHTSFSKKIFAKGAVNAVDFILKQKPGLYGLNEINIK